MSDRPTSGALRRVERHYGPGPHPGTGTPQSVHGGGSPAASVEDGSWKQKCDRCGGWGIIDAYRDVNGGVCFECGGLGWTPGKGEYDPAQEWQGMEALREERKEANERIKQFNEEQDARMQNKEAGPTYLEGLISTNPALPFWQSVDRERIIQDRQIWSEEYGQWIDNPEYAHAEPWVHQGLEKAFGKEYHWYHGQAEIAPEQVENARFIWDKIETLMGNVSGETDWTDVKGYPVRVEAIRKLISEIKRQRKTSRGVNDFLTSLANQFADKGYLTEGQANALLRTRSEIIDRHYGPGAHPGTGTPQSVHGGGSPAASTDGKKIVRIISVKDTRDYEEDASGRWHPIAGSGTEHQCDRCGATHEVHATVLLEDGSTCIVGTTCARAEFSEQAQREIKSKTHAAKRLKKLQAEFEAKQNEQSVWDLNYLQVQTLPQPEITFEEGYSFRNEPILWAVMDDARVSYSIKGVFDEERKQTLIETWWKKQMAKRGFNQLRPKLDREKYMKDIAKLQDVIDDAPEIIERGGPGSGHWGHRGTPGSVGGSMPRTAGTHLGGIGIPDFSDGSKKTFVAQRTLNVENEMVVALVYMRRMEIFKTKPYRIESRWFVRNRTGPATDAQSTAGIDLLKSLRSDVLAMLEITGWLKSEQGNDLYIAPWGANLIQDIRLVQRPGAVLRHYGPGPHPGTGTEQTIHAKGGSGRRPTGGKAAQKQYPTSAEPLSNEEEFTFTRMQAFLDEPTQRSEDGVFGVAYTQEKWVSLAEEIIDSFPPEVREAMAEAEDKIRAGTQTIEQFTDPETGEWKPEREMLHQRIIDQIMKEAGDAPQRAEGEQPIFWATGGLPGAGKSTVMRARGEDIAGPGTVSIDSDRIKAMFPEYEGWNAALLHEESSHVVGELMRRAREGGYNIAYDATLKTTSKAQELIDEVRAAGYSPRVIYVDIPMAMAMERAVDRFMRGGRYVPPQYIATHDSKNIRTLSTIRDQLDYWEHWDNSQPRGEAPRLLASGGSLEQ